MKFSKIAGIQVPLIVYHYHSCAIKIKPLNSLVSIFPPFSSLLSITTKSTEMNLNGTIAGIHVSLIVSNCQSCGVNIKPLKKRILKITSTNNKNERHIKEASQGYRYNALYPSSRIILPHQRMQNAAKNTIQKELPQSTKPFSRNKLKTCFQNVNKQAKRPEFRSTLSGFESGGVCQHTKITVRSVRACYAPLTKKAIPRCCYGADTSVTRFIGDAFI